MMSGEGLPEPTFALIVDQIAASALVQLGAVPNPITGKTETSLERARFSLAQLELLGEKTRGNLSTREAQHLEDRITQISERLDAEGAG